MTMNPLDHLVSLHLILMAFFLCFSATASKLNDRQVIRQDDLVSIIVDKFGHGNFSTVQAAIDSVPDENTQWIRIIINPGIYSEKVTVPKEKQFIFLEGKSRRTTIIQWNDAGNPIESSTFLLHADNFAASRITFKNTYNVLISSTDNRMTWAPAILVDADKVFFYQCGFSSLQDTVTDARGRHFYQECFIQGAVDFIWGGGQSLFQSCIINFLGSGLPVGTPGYITAQGRGSLEDPSGFVFKNAEVIGTGKTYLGRAYTPFSRVIFYRSNLSPIIVPEGWSPWNQASHLNTVTFVEADCVGQGADMEKRVQWLKNLTSTEFQFFLKSSDFIDKDKWVEKVPVPTPAPLEQARYGEYLVAAQANQASIARTISIPGDYEKIQDAIDQGVANLSNNQWTLIKLAPGIYNETILITGNKSNIILEGGGRDNTIVSWRSSGLKLREAPLMLNGANNFIAKGITFKNTLHHDRGMEENGAAFRAVAAMVDGEHISFYECGFVSSQDTLWDKSGHHLFKSCYIEGYMDFIFGDATSVYEDCKINSTGRGCITAQKRESPESPSGFVFKHAEVGGVGPTNLGRAYGQYSRVLFYRSKFADIVRPEGWDNLGVDPKQITYAEVECSGAGADTSKRVPWLKHLEGTHELKDLLSSSFNDEDQWIENQPNLN